MRPTICVTLLAVCLSVRGLDARTPAIRRTAEGTRASGPSAAAKSGPWSATVSAHGPTQAEARQAVLDKAYQSVASYLLQRLPGLRWVPSAEELGRWVSLQEPSDPTLEQPSPGALFQYKAELRVEVTDKDVEEILAEEQRTRAREGEQLVRQRQLWSAKLLVALVALLAAVAVYFRLEELTRGYYTGVLRVLLLLCVGAIGAGLWLVL